jgi:hypothetical protein
MGMRIPISVASILACAFSLHAQIDTTLSRSSDGSTDIKIRNNSAVSLVAYAIRVNRVASAAVTRGPLVEYYDPAIDPEIKPLAPNETRTLFHIVLICAPEGRRLEIKNEQDKQEFLCELDEPVTAGILADGSTTGDAALLARLLLRRSNMLLAVETTLEMLSNAGRSNVTRDYLIAQFKKMADSVRRWYLPPEQRIGLGLYQSIIGKLINLPDGPVGSPFPPADFVASETATLRQRRIALLDSQPSLVDATLDLKHPF